MAKKKLGAPGTGTPGTPDAGRKRGASQYWLVRRIGDTAPEAPIHYELVSAGFSTPAAGWEYAAKEKLVGELHVLCHRGTKHGKKQEVFDLE